MRFEDYILNTFIGEKADIHSISSGNNFCGKEGCCRSCMKRYDGCLCLECKCTQCCWHWDNRCNFKESNSGKVRTINLTRIEYEVIWCQNCFYCQNARPVQQLEKPHQLSASSASPAERNTMSSTSESLGLT